MFAWVDIQCQLGMKIFGKKTCIGFQHSTFRFQAMFKINITRSCTLLILQARTTGFYADGYLELPPQEMGRDSDMSFSFVTMQSEGLIFFARGEDDGNEVRIK
jgi:hypothetical protein